MRGEPSTITLDHRIFAAFGAPPDLHGAGLAAAVALAQWALLLGPAALAGLWWFGAVEDRAAAVAAGFAGALGLAAAATLSMMVVVPRPFMDSPAANYLDHVRDSSFPSDHATLAFALSFALWRWRPPKIPWIWLPLLVLGIAIGWARVFLGAHYPSDIGGGALVAAAAVAALATSAGRAVLGILCAVAEGSRMRAVAGWRRLAPVPRRPGDSNP